MWKRIYVQKETAEANDLRTFQCIKFDHVKKIYEKYILFTEQCYINKNTIVWVKSKMKKGLCFGLTLKYR